MWETRRRGWGQRRGRDATDASRERDALLAFPRPQLDRLGRIAVQVLLSASMISTLSVDLKPGSGLGPFTIGRHLLRLTATL